jgi:hypothetical protein
VIGYMRRRPYPIEESLQKPSRVRVEVVPVSETGV